jgi:hypothetical protein
MRAETPRSRKIREGTPNDKESTVRIFLNILAGLLIVVGTVWILQGVNILPGSFMTGQIVWAWRGGAAAVVGILLLVVANRKRR